MNSLHGGKLVGFERLRGLRRGSDSRVERSNGSYALVIEAAGTSLQAVFTVVESWRK
jgi:hypothetical protein